MGSVVCVSPHGYTYVLGTAITTPDIPGGGAADYSSIAANPPFRATEAPKTTLWYVTQQDDTCTLITMTYPNGLSLLAKVNSSIDAEASDGCSATIMPSYTYLYLPSSTPTQAPTAEATQ